MWWETGRGELWDYEALGQLQRAMLGRLSRGAEIDSLGGDTRGAVVDEGV